MTSLFNHDHKPGSFTAIAVLTVALLTVNNSLFAAPLVSSLVLDDSSTQSNTSIQEPTGVLSLDQAIALATQYQPLQAVWQGRQQIAEANLQQSKLWDNPEISIDQTGFSQKNDRELTIGVAQKIDLFGVRGARQKLANIALQSEQVRQLAYQSQLKLAVTAAYWRVTQAEWAVKLQQDQTYLSANSEQVAQRRLNAGRIAEVEYSRVLVAHQQAQSQLTATQAALQEARFQLTRLWGNTQPIFAGTQAGSSNLQQNGWPVINLDQIAAGLTNNPQQTLLQQQQRQAEAALSLAQAQAKPQPSLRLGVNQTRNPASQDGLKTGTDNRLTLGVSIPIPVFNRNQGVIKATRALSQIAQAQQDYVVSKRSEQVQAGLIKLEALSNQYQQLQIQQLPLAKSIQQKTLQGFEAGKFSVTEVQQATREYQTLQFNQLQLLSQAWQLSLQLDALSLGLDAGFDMNNTNALDNNQFQLWQDTQVMPIIGAGE